MTNLQHYEQGSNPNNAPPPPLITAGTATLDQSADTLLYPADDSQLLLQNGNFSAPSLGTSNWKTYSGITGWTALSGNLIELQKFSNLAIAGQYCELDSHWPTSDHSQPSDHGIQQTLNLARGHYLLFFDYRGRQAGADSLTAKLKSVGSSTETVLLTKTAASTTEWKRAIVSFEITGGNPNLTTVPVTLLFDIADAADSYGAYIDNVILLPVELRQPTISDEGAAVDLASVNRVRFCRWLGAFYGKDYADSAQFPKHDQDRFVIHLPMQSKAGAGTVSVWLSTEDAAGAITDDPTEIELTETAANSGVFESPALALVADKEDDELTRDENAKNDPTHFGKAGGKIVVKVPELQNVEVKFDIEKATHKLKLDFVSVTPPVGSGAFVVKLWATGATSPETVSLTREQCLEAIEKQMKRCIEIYAQLGIEVDATDRGSLAAYSQGGADTAAWQRVDAAIRKGNVESGTTLDSIPQAERGFDLLGRISDIQQLCHDLKKEDNIVVVLLPAAFADIPGTPGDERGSAGIYVSAHEGWCFLSIPWVTQVVTKSGTAAHEVGHALGLQHDSRKQYELMIGEPGGRGIATPTGEPYLDQKRFTWPDIKKLLKERISNPLAKEFLIPLTP